MRILGALLYWAFDVLWAVVGFLALRWAGSRYFSGKWRASVFAAAVVVAFAVGTWWPFSDRHLAATAPANAPPEVALATTPVAASRDVSSICRKVQSISRDGSQVLGSLDVVGVMVAGQPVARQSGFTIARDETISVQGWSAVAATKVPALAACLLVDDQLQPASHALYGIARPDVATAYHIDAMASTGYLLTLDARNLRPGDHKIGVAVVTGGGATALSTNVSVHAP